MSRRIRVSHPFLCMFLLLLFAFAMSACEVPTSETKSKDTPAAEDSASSVAPDVPVAEKSVGASVDDAFRAKVQSMDNVFDLYDMKMQYAKEGKKDSAEAKVVDAKYEEILASLAPVTNFASKSEPSQAKAEPFSDTLDFYQFDFRKIDQKKNEYRVSFLFKVTKPIAEDYTLYLYGDVEEQYVGQIITKTVKDGKTLPMETWRFLPVPKSSTWKPGEFVVVQKTIVARPIPYEMRFVFSIRETGEQRSRYVPLGWHVDAGQ